MKQKELELSPEQRLALLRRLDRRHPWATPDERRLCLGCGRIIRGWEVRIRRSMGGVGPIRLRCSSEGCQAGPADGFWRMTLVAPRWRRTSHWPEPRRGEGTVVIRIEGKSVELTAPLRDAVAFAMGWTDHGYARPTEAMRRIVGELAVDRLQWTEEWRAAAMLREFIRAKWH